MNNDSTTRRNSQRIKQLELKIDLLVENLASLHERTVEVTQIQATLAKVIRRLTETKGPVEKSEKPRRFRRKS